MLRRILRKLVLLTAVLLVAIAVLAIVIIEREPAVPAFSAPTPDDVEKARTFVRNVRSAINPDNEQSVTLVSNEDQLRAVAKLGTRTIPGVRSEFHFQGNKAIGIASAPIPFTNNSLWINLHAAAPEFEGEFKLSELKLGPISLPPGAALKIGRVAANLVVGNQFGDTVLSAATKMKIDGDAVEFELSMGEMGTNGMMRGVFGALRGSEMPGPAEIERYYTQIRQAMDNGTLPNEGSYLPYLQFTLQAAHEGGAREGIENAYTSAILALARVCGARDFTLIVGGLFEDTFDNTDNWNTDCSQLTLNDRIDSRRHFTTAAAIQAASNRGFSVSVGEFKELYDTLRSGGFDFTDIAANNSGIRMSDTLMATTIENWPKKLASITNENSLIVSYDNIPQIMSGEEFERIYTDVNSEAYLTMIAQIENKISKISLHAE